MRPFIVRAERRLCVVPHPCAEPDAAVVELTCLLCTSVACYTGASLVELAGIRGRHRNHSLTELGALWWLWHLLVTALLNSLYHWLPP